MSIHFKADLTYDVALTATFPFEIRKHAAFYSYEKVPAGISSERHPIKAQIETLEIALESNLG
jgi:hypothetical protein